MWWQDVRGLVEGIMLHCPLPDWLGGACARSVVDLGNNCM